MFCVSASKPLSRVVFDTYDSDKSGTINRAELKKVCYGLGHYLTEEEEAMALHRLDTNGDGTISYSEFAVWWREKDRFAEFDMTDTQRQAMLQCIQYFRYFDRDASGALSADEFVHLHADLVRNGYGAHLSGDPQEDLKRLDSNVLLQPSVRVSTGGLSLRLLLTSGLSFLSVFPGNKQQYPVFYF